MTTYFKKTIAQQRGYVVKSTDEAKQIGTLWLEHAALQNAVDFGLPGIGITGKAATKLGRRFVLIEQEPKYARIILDEVKEWLGEKAKDVLTFNLALVEADDVLELNYADIQNLEQVG